MKQSLLSMTAGGMIEALRPMAAKSVEVLTNNPATINRMISQKWRITQAVYGPGLTVWPPSNGMTATDVLAECAERLQEAKTDDGRIYDGFRVTALRQAESALLKIITAPDEIFLGDSVCDWRDPRFVGRVDDLLDNIALVRWEKGRYSLLRTIDLELV